MFIQIKDGKAVLPKSNLEIEFIDDKKAMEDMQKLGEDWEKEEMKKPIYQILQELLEINKDNIESSGFTNLNGFDEEEENG